MQGAGDWRRFGAHTRDLLTVAVLALVALPGSSVAIQDLDREAVSQALLDARHVSYTESWQAAQLLLDEMASDLDDFEPRAFADFHLLEARHLTLADRSPEALDRAAMLLELPLDDDQRLRALQFGANVAVLLRQYEIAFEYLMQALVLAPDVDDPAASMATHNMAGYMFGRVGEHERAIEYGQLAVRQARDTGDPNDECVSRQRLAPVFKWAGDELQAEEEYRRGIDVCLETGNALFAGVLQHGLADLLRQAGRLEEALALAELAVEALDDGVFPLGEHEARLVVAEILNDMGSEPERLDQILAILDDYFAGRELHDQQARLELLKVDVAVGRRDLDAVVEAYQSHLEARDRFFGRDRAMLMGYLQVEFDLALKAQQIELLEESAQLARLEAVTSEQRRRARSTILLLSGVLLILLSLMLWRAFRARQHFQHLSRHDRLSGLANHAWFFERADVLLQSSPANAGNAFLVVADIDHFKEINDQLGHLVGDQVLEQISRRLRLAFGEQALVGRIGGEEFGVLMHGSVDDVIESIERFRQGAVDGVRQGDPQVTLSFGVATYHSGDSLTELRGRADHAMYQAKRSGRNCYVFEDGLSDAGQS